MSDFLTQHMKQYTTAYLSHLVSKCQNRYLNAVDLLGIRNDIVSSLRHASVYGGISLSPLLPSWEHLCDRYLVERYDRNPRLSKDFEEDIIQMWNSYIYHELFPNLLRDHEFVRNVLRAIGQIPCKSRGNAMQSIYTYFDEMSLEELMFVGGDEEELGV